MEEFHQSVKATLYERAKKPFTGTFILAWIACNWKLLVAILFISEAYLDGITRIDYIDDLDLLKSTNLVWEPLGITIVALVFFGILNILAALLVVQFKNFQFTYIDKRTKVDAANYGKLLDQLKNIKDKWAKEIESINKSRADLTSSNNNYISKNNKLVGEANFLRKDLKEYEQKSQTYGEALKKASELLDSYKMYNVNIKKNRSLNKTMNTVTRHKALEEIVMDINKRHDDIIG
tara:strand:+ start:1212 stop:1916 length:705 start_codon:yes stop_codon:yes gene_type:complete